MMEFEFPAMGVVSISNSDINAQSGNNELPALPFSNPSDELKVLPFK